MDANKRPWSLPQIASSAFIAILLWSAVGFNWFGFGFNWSTSVGASRISDAALTASRASICVAQARSASDFGEKLQQLSELDNWKRREFLDSTRWSTMPGDESAAGGVSDLCIEKLLES